MKTTLVTAPVEKPVSLDEAKAQLRQTSDSEDTYITALIADATAYVENVTGRKLVTQTHRLFLDEWPDTYIELPFGKAQSVSSVSYKDSDGNTTTWDSGGYVLDSYSEPGLIYREYDGSWPDATLYHVNPITVEFVCGYGAASAVPENIKLAIKQLITHWFENRELVVVGTSVDENADLPYSINSLLSPYRLWSF